MASAAPPRYLASPPDTAVQAVQFGLLSAAILVDEGDSKPDHWENGVRWEPLSCGPARVTVDDCPPFGSTTVPTVEEKQFDNGEEGVAEALPFTVYAPYKCSLIGRDIDEPGRRARQRLINGEERAVEAAFASSTLGNAPTLASSDAEDLTPTAAPTILGGMTILEDYLARCSGGRGIIHMTRGLVPSGFNGNLLHHMEVNGRPRLFTQLGTPVVAGAGYDFNGPDGTAPPAGEAWMYVTSPVVIWRGPIFETPGAGREWEGVDREKNDIYALAERTYVVGFDDCCHAAVRVKVGCCC